MTETKELRLLRQRRVADYYAAMSAVDCLVSARHDRLAQVSSWFDPRLFISDEWCREIFAACVRLADKQAPIQSRTLANELYAAGKDTPTFRQGIITLFRQADYATQACHIEFNCQCCYEHWRAERAIGEIDKAGAALTDGQPVDPTLDSLAMLPERLPAREHSQLADISESFHEILDDLEGGVARGWHTGIDMLDRYISPMRPGTLMVVAAPTGGGKTVLMAQLAMRMAREGRHALLFALEMPASDMIKRWAAACARAPLRDSDAIRDAVTELFPLCSGADATLHIKDSTHRIDAIERMVLSYAAKMDIGMVVVDYLQLVRADKSIREREQQVADVSRRLKQLAMKARTIVVTGSQLNRAGQDKPELRSLRESGAIEQDADVVLLMKPDGSFSETVSLGVGIAKNRHGEQGKVVLSWDRPWFTIRDSDAMDNPARYAEFDEHNERSF